MTGGIVYSATILEHFKRPRHTGEIADADLVGEANNPLCGDRIRIGLRLRDGVIDEARFRADACAICTASASLLMEHVQGQSMTFATTLNEAGLLDALDARIPEERRRCATLPLEALQAAQKPERPE